MSDPSDRAWLIWHLTNANVALRERVDELETSLELSEAESEQMLRTQCRLNSELEAIKTPPCATTTRVEIMSLLRRVFPEAKGHT